MSKLYAEVFDVSKKLAQNNKPLDTFIKGMHDGTDDAIIKPEGLEAIEAATSEMDADRKF